MNKEERPKKSHVNAVSWLWQFVCFRLINYFLSRLGGEAAMQGIPVWVGVARCIFPMLSLRYRYSIRYSYQILSKSEFELALTSFESFCVCVCVSVFAWHEKSCQLLEEYNVKRVYVLVSASLSSWLTNNVTFELFCLVPKWSLADSAWW